jgi:ribosomal protein S18 acetylase RimI-like enzyme
MIPWMVTQSRPHETGIAAGGRLRPINPARDLGAIARLIEIAFAEDLSPGGHAVMRDLQALNVLSPLIWFLSQVNPAFEELLSGFVWEENGTIVGNTTLTRAEGQPNYWIISNVAVMPTYRRRGIARAMVSAAIQYAREHHAHRVLLQVRADNEGARTLYYSLGFQSVEAVVELQAFRPTLPPWEPSPQVVVRAPDRQRWHEAYDVARMARPAAVQRLRPLRAANFHVEERDLFTRMGEWIAGRWRERLWAETSGKVRGLLTIERFRGGTPDRLEGIIHPEARGLVEPDLVRAGLERVRHRRHIRANVSTYEAPLLDVLRRSGFQEIRTLEQMVLDIE